MEVPKVSIKKARVGSVIECSSSMQKILVLDSNAEKQKTKPEDSLSKLWYELIKSSEGLEFLLFFQSCWIQFPEPTWQLITVTPGDLMPTTFKN